MAVPRFQQSETISGLMPLAGGGGGVGPYPTQTQFARNAILQPQLSSPVSGGGGGGGGVAGMNSAAVAQYAQQANVPVSVMASLLQKQRNGTLAPQDLTAIAGVPPAMLPRELGGYATLLPTMRRSAQSSGDEAARAFPAHVSPAIWWQAQVSADAAGAVLFSNPFPGGEVGDEVLGTSSNPWRYGVISFTVTYPAIQGIPSCHIVEDWKLLGAKRLTFIVEGSLQWPNREFEDWFNPFPDWDKNRGVANYTLWKGEHQEWEIIRYLVCSGMERTVLSRSRMSVFVGHTTLVQNDYTSGRAVLQDLERIGAWYRRNPSFSSMTVEGNPFHWPSGL